MKYIRTKDGHIYCGKDEMLLEIGYYSTANGSPVIAVADTIEELCDEFDAVNIGVFRDSKKTYKSVQEAEADKTFLYDILYGVVYTDKGRIYLAEKFGSKEWELV